MDISCKTMEIVESFNSDIEKVFNWYSDINKRIKWCVPDGSLIEFVENDFSIGGRDVTKCGLPGHLEFITEINYIEIINNRLIIFSEKVLKDDNLLACSLNTLKYDLSGNKSELKIILHVNSFVGEEMLVGYLNGWRSVISNLKNLVY